MLADADKMIGEVADGSGRFGNVLILNGVEIET